MPNPNVLTTRATRKTTRFRQRDAKYNAAGAMYRVAWALHMAKGTGQKCEKPWENQGLPAERTGGEQLHKTRGKWKILASALQNPVHSLHRHPMRTFFVCAGRGLQIRLFVVSPL